MSAMMVWGAIVISALACLAFVAAMVIAYLTHDTASQQQLVGAIIATFSTVVSFWVGSSAGSQKKDDRLGRIAEGESDSPPKDKTI